MKLLRGTLLVIALGALLPALAHARLEVKKVKIAGKGFKDPAATVTVVVKGTVTPLGDLEPLAPVTMAVGDFEQTLVLDATNDSNKKVSFKAEKGADGIKSFKLTKKNGKFTLKAIGVSPASLGEDAVVTFDVGGSRFTASLAMRGGGKTRQWKRGKDELTVTVVGRVFGVEVDEGAPLISPEPDPDGTRFQVRNNAEEVVIGQRTPPDDDGCFVMEATVTDPDLLDALDLSQVLGSATDRTQPQLVEVTHGSDGEVLVSTFVQELGPVAEALAPEDAAMTLVVPVGPDQSAGTLTLPEGTAEAPIADLSFTPYTLPLQIPAPLPDEFFPVAGAEVLADGVASFDGSNRPTVVLERPDWIAPDELTGADLVLLQFSGGEWTERSGDVAYVPGTDTVGPDMASLDPAGLENATPMVYAVRQTPIGKKKKKKKPPVFARRRHRTVVRGSTGGNVPLAGVTVLTVNGASVTDPSGEAVVPVGTLSDGDPDVVQVLTAGLASARVVTASAESEPIGLDVSDETGAALLLGTISGVVRNEVGAPIPGAVVRVRVSDAITGMKYDDGDTPMQFNDDRFVVADLSALGVTNYDWRLILQGGEVFDSVQHKGNTVRPFDLLLEAQAAIAGVGPGVYTVRASFDLGSGKRHSIFAGFRFTTDSGPAISAVRLPPSFASSAQTFSSPATTDGSYTASLLVPDGIALAAVAVQPGGEMSAPVLFRHATGAKVDLVVGTPLTRWVDRKPMQDARHHHGSAAIGGLIYVVGGVDVQGADVRSFEVYDPDADDWAMLTPPAVTRADACVVALAGKLYVIGGLVVGSPTNSVDVYDPGTGNWSPGTPMPTARTGASAVVVQGRIHVFGGSTGPTGLTKVHEVYDLAGDQWSGAADMQTARDHAVAGRIDGVIYVAGGNTAGQGTAEVESYDSVADEWTARTPLPEGRSGASGGVLGGILYVVGGQAPDGSLRATTLAYVPAPVDDWATTLPPHATPHEFAAAVATATGRLAVSGGVTIDATQVPMLLGGISALASD